MRLDELHQELAALVERTPRPDGDVDGAVRSGRARLARRRASFSVVAVVAIVAVAVGLVARNDSPRRGLVVSTPTNATSVPPDVPAVVQPATSQLIFTSADEGWVCGDPVRHTADGGQTWQQLRDDFGVTDLSGRACAGVSGDLWIATGARAVNILPIQGGVDIAGPAPFPTLPDHATVTQVTFADVQHGWVLARTPGDGPGHGYLYRSTQSGIRFRLVSRDAPVNFVTFVNANEGWGIGDAQLEHSTDAGATWTVVPTPFGRTPVLERVWVFGSTVVVAGESNTASTFVPFFFVSTDGGASFDVHKLPAAVASADLRHQFVVVDPAHWRLTSGGRLWRTDDGGSTWTSDPLPASELSSIAFPTPTEGWAISGADVLKTSDAGRTWRAVDTTPEPAWSAHLASVPDGCPTGAVSAVADAVAAEQTARQFVLRARGWSGDLDVVTYRVGAQGRTYSAIFADNVSKFCGTSVEHASYAVEIYNPLITQDNSRITALVVAHFTDGWRVWGFYR